MFRIIVALFLVFLPTSYGAVAGSYAAACIGAQIELDKRNAVLLNARLSNDERAAAVAARDAAQHEYDVCAQSAETARALGR